MNSNSHPVSPEIIEQILSRAEITPDGNPVMLNFFRTDCPWCAAFIPHLSEVYARHDLRLQIHEVGIAGGDDTPEKAAQFKREKLIVFPVITDDDGALRTAFGISRVPSIVVISADGQIARVYEGVTEQLSGILEQTLFAIAARTEPPAYSMIGNGCAP